MAKRSRASRCKNSQAIRLNRPEIRSGNSGAYRENHRWRRRCHALRGSSSRWHGSRLPRQDSHLQRAAQHDRRPARRLNWQTGARVKLTMTRVPFSSLVEQFPEQTTVTVGTDPKWVGFDLVHGVRSRVRAKKPRSDLAEIVVRATEPPSRCLPSWSPAVIPEETVLPRSPCRGNTAQSA